MRFAKWAPPFVVLVVVATGLSWCSEANQTVELRGRIVDNTTGQPLPARIYIRGEDGLWYFPKTASPNGSAIEYRKQRPGTPKSIEMHTTLSAHAFVVELAPGKYTFTIERGHEYVPQTKQIVLGKNPQPIVFKLQRWINMSERGWYSGDTHVHRNLEELPNVMLAEDLNVALPLVYWVTQAFTPPRLGAKSTQKDPPAKVINVDATHLIYPRNTEYEIFTVGKKRHTLGAFFVLNHKSIFEKGVPPVRPIAEQAHKEEALLELDKPNWPWSMMLVPIMDVDLYELSNNHIWRTEFGFPKFGIPAPDFMKVEKKLGGFTENGWIDFNFQNYYTLLNCGFRMRPTAGTASGVHPVPLGFGRVYVHCGKDFTYKNWIKGLDQGRSMVTTGPMLFVEVNGKKPGHTFKQEGANDYRVNISCESAYPLDRIEVIVNGQIARSISPRNLKKTINKTDHITKYGNQYNVELPIEATSWIAVRCFEQRAGGRVRFAHSGPVHIDVAGKPLLPRLPEIRFLIQRVEEELKRHTGVLPEAALQEYRTGLAIYRAIEKKTKMAASG